MGAWKPFVMGIAGVFVGIILLVGVGYAANIFTVDKDGTVRLVITDAGNVGIGTTTPAAPLHLQSTANYYPQVQVENIGGTGAGYFLLKKANGVVDARTDVVNGNSLGTVIFQGWKDNAYRNSSYIESYVDAAPGAGFVPSQLGFVTTNASGVTSTKMVVLSSGEVGIGRSPAANKFEVEGNVSKTTAGDWLANSDARIKTDVRDLADAAETIRQLHPVKFRYTEEYKAKHPSIEGRDYVNFIAQEYRAIFPESVKDDGAGLLQIDTHNVTPYLVAAMQELMKRVDRLEEENTRLKNSMLRQ